MTTPLSEIAGEPDRTVTETSVEEDVIVTLRQIIRATDLGARKLAISTGLTTSQVLVLQNLRRTPGLTISKLAEENSLRQATVTTLIDKLEAKELVRRHRSEADRRRVEIFLTDAGQELISRTPAILQNRLNSRLEQLEDWEKSWLLAALQRVAAMLDAEEIDAAPVLDTGAIDKLPVS